MEFDPVPEPSLDSFYTGPTSWQEAFPPVCIKTHWDPTQVSRHVLPSLVSPIPTMDPRQEVRICQQYYTTSRGDAPLATEVEEPLSIPASLLGGKGKSTDISTILPGGAAGLNTPYDVYAANIQVESDVQRRDEPLSKCKERRFVPKSGPSDATNTLPNVSQAFEMAPYALHVEKRAGCREADDEAAWNRSARLFNNTTRMDRYDPKGKRGPLAC
jgi:hypothetical protein